MDAAEKQALENIERYGCHILHIMAEGESPPFSYTVGIQRASNAPELIVIGLKQPIAHFILNEYNRRVREGERFSDGQFSSGFLEGFDCLFREVDSVNYREYLGWGNWFYGRESFKTLQLIYPNTSGVWPWQSEADQWFKSWQPSLAAEPR
ncbi:DUF4262 domain-containing protein [Methylophilus sp. 13]|uniref:DUF4262 domain-containing protein n=1 Tax=Methylophilus sp. 13 TaxID=2781018 RepID=UPI00188E43E2|nr:DUF4262 domain-containing protein [Methylophilus sp. 13]MBF5038237.1 DUF4262 domain-containing protein [Methylophilus sp. 13]